jgi:hypothetical protein
MCFFIRQVFLITVPVTAAPKWQPMSATMTARFLSCIIGLLPLLQRTWETMHALHRRISSLPEATLILI